MKDENAVDSTEFFHLTPRGWFQGSAESVWPEAYRSTVEPPPDRVETWKHEWFQSSSGGPEDESWQMVWSSADVNSKDRELLHERFPYDLGPVFSFMAFKR